MKTATQWAARIQNSKEPWPKLVELIQQDAIAEGMRRAAAEVTNRISLLEALGAEDTYSMALHELRQRERNILNAAASQANP